MYGRHLLIDFYGCTFQNLDDRPLIERTLLTAAEKANATILNHFFHQFSPQGVSGAVIIAESHISIHTWPEKGYAALDLFTCGDTMSPETAIEVLKDVFQPSHTQIRDYERGRIEHADMEIRPEINSSRDMRDR